MFEKFQPAKTDPILGLSKLFHVDPRAEKIDLGVGVYKDKDGITPVMSSVKKAEARLLREQNSKAYVSLAGAELFRDQMRDLVLGDAVVADRVATLQTPGGTGAIRQTFESMKILNPDCTIWISDPSWPSHMSMATHMGFKTRSYPYFDSETRLVDTAAMMGSFQDLKTGDLLLLHGCCHNPTGSDLSLTQWERVAEVCKKIGLLPFIDLVYQGLGKGIEEDVEGIRTLVRIVPEVIITVSSSKTFGVYRDRCGLIAVITDVERVKSDALETMLSEIARELYFHPPDHAASVINILLEDLNLRKDWISELDTMQKRIVALRGKFSSALQEYQQSDFFSFLNTQNGMFSLLPISNAGVMSLRNDKGIYLMPDGRINIASLPENKIDYLAKLISELPEFN